MNLSQQEVEDSLPALTILYQGERMPLFVIPRAGLNTVFGVTSTGLVDAAGIEWVGGKAK